MIEIRWHGRGGQGAKTAALLLADAAFETGLYVQGFPEYGPERMGAPITAYNRLNEAPIRVHSNIYEPDMVVVVDETLLKSVDVTAGLKPGGKLLVNSRRQPAEVLADFPDFGGEIYVIDAADISIRTIGRNLPNTPLLSAAVKLTGILKEADFFTNMEKAFAEKFASKPEVISGNLNALKDAWTAAIRINE
ncbi:MAG: 2-oxoacid:acceptor oxidoreductase family protein [Clostridiales Family XIII bacterium]|jgi:pyruvate ferredoxin oxidoreductase gamma subunit|nr:2-oxoacid:acceptor oxidoreductase family protein [Clostridiales Family XIII bacterium]